jgi:hypothetical protein
METNVDIDVQVPIDTGGDLENEHRPSHGEVGLDERVHDACDVVPGHPRQAALAHARSVGIIHDRDLEGPWSGHLQLEGGIGVRDSELLASVEGEDAQPVLSILQAVDIELKPSSGRHPSHLEVTHRPPLPTRGRPNDGPGTLPLPLGRDGDRRVQLPLRFPGGRAPTSMTTFVVRAEVI